MHNIIAKTLKASLLIVSFTWLSATAEAQSFSFTINSECVGVIVNAKTGHTIGTGFVLGSGCAIITCAHVVSSNDEYLYEPARTGTLQQGTRKAYQVKLKHIFPKYDLAVLLADADVTKKPLNLGNFQEIRPGDLVIYCGWVKGTKTLQVNQARVLASGDALNDTANAVVEFLEFKGVGKPGYSGGPVFDSDGNVIAIVREAWTKRGIKGGSKSLINRAFSIDILSEKLTHLESRIIK